MVADGLLSVLPRHERRLWFDGSGRVVWGSFSGGVGVSSSRSLPVTIEKLVDGGFYGWLCWNPCENEVVFGVCWVAFAVEVWEGF